MKIFSLLFVMAFSFVAMPALADSTAHPGNVSLATRTATIAKSTLGLAQDTAITTYIYAKLASHPNLTNANIDISTTDGKVTLNGIVTDESQAKEIQRLAESTAGVSSVDASKIIISQQENGLYVKAKTNPPPPQTIANNDKNAQTIAQPDMQVSAADPLLTHLQDPLNQKNKPTAIIKKPFKPFRLAQNSQKPHSLQATQQHQKKKTSPTTRIKKQKHPPHKKLPKKKTAAYHSKSKLPIKHHTKQIEKHLAKQNHPTGKPKKTQTVAHKNSNESVDEMTSHFLKEALMANKEIPEA